MSPTITITDDTFNKLQALATPFVDTPESVIARLADVELAGQMKSSSGRSRKVVLRHSAEVLELDPHAPGSLTHTRLLSATVDGEPLPRPKWNGVKEHLHVLARARLGSFDAVRRASEANLREGRYEQNGYKYLPGADLSIQGTDTNLAWRHSLHLCRAVGVPISLKLEWRDKEGAAHPGEIAALSWTPSESGSRSHEGIEKMQKV